MSNSDVNLKIRDYFSITRMLAVTQRVLKQLIRDKRTFGMLLIMPILIMLIFGIALTGEIKNVPIILMNEDQPYTLQYQPNPMGPVQEIEFDTGENITEHLLQDDRVNVDQSFDDWSRAIQKVEEGQYSSVIRIPSDFSERLANKTLNASIILEIEIYIDATKPSIRASVMGALQEALQDSLGAQSVEFDETFAFGNAEYSGLDVAIPAVMALVLTFLVLLVSLVTIVRDRLYGTQFRMYSTPVTKIERLLGFVLALSIIGILMVLSVIMIGTLVFGAEVRGNFLILLASAFLYTLSHIFLAVFLSNFTQNELQAVQFAPLISFPSMALSGMLVPINSLPPIAQTFSDFLPMTYGVRIFEGIMLKGLEVGDLLYDFGIIGVFTLIAFFLAIITVKDKMED